MSLLIVALPVLLISPQPAVASPTALAPGGTTTPSVEDDALSPLRLVAAIISGDVILKVDWTAGTGGPGTGTLSMSYANAASATPSASAEATLRASKESAGRTTPLLRALASIADADGSGRVSSGEASDVRDTFEFGVKLSAIAEHYPPGTTDSATFCTVLHMTPDAFNVRLRAYASLLKALERTPTHFLPPVPAFPRP